MNYFDIYKLRLNSNGYDYQSRILNERKKLFSLYLKKSIYKIEFKYEGEYITGSFERYKQDDSELLHYLLVDLDINIPNGTILQLPNKDGIEEDWMVYYLEVIETSGYNRYIMMKFDATYEWYEDGEFHSGNGFLFGPHRRDMMLTIKHNIPTIYLEDYNKYCLIIPTNTSIKLNAYIVVEKGTELEQHFKVSGFDIQSTKGIEYITLEPCYEYDFTPPPKREETNDEDSEFFWIETKGEINGRE